MIMNTENLTNKDDFAVQGSSEALGWRALLPFLLVGVIWLVLGIVIGFQINVLLAVRWFVILWGLTVLDLLFLAKALLLVLKFVGGSNKQELLVIPIIFWAVLKFTFFCGLTIILLKVSGIPSFSLLMGLSTLVVIPLCGGMLWNYSWFRHQEAGKTKNKGFVIHA